MTAEECIQILKGIQNKINEAPITNLIFGAKMPGDDPTFSIKQAQFHERLLADFKKITSNTTRNLCDCNLIPYDPSYKPDPNEVMYFRIDDHQAVKDMIELAKDIEGLALLTEDPDYLKNILFYGIFHKLDDNELLYLSSISPQNVLKKSTKLGIFFSNGLYDRLEENSLLIDKDIDCFSFKEYVFILNVTGFHRLSQYHDEILKTASQVIEKFVAIIPIDNIENFKSFGTNDYRMAAKLAGIKNKPYISTLTMDRVKQVIANYNLSIALKVGADGIERLVFESDPQKRFLILKVLDDDYLHSGMTEYNYAVNSKIATK